MTSSAPGATSRARLAAAAIVAAMLVGAGVARADSTPVGPLPAGPVSTITTKPGQLVAVALPHASASSGLVWRVARRYDSKVVRQLSEADVGPSVVVVFRVAGKGRTSVVFALTRGDTSSKAVKAATYRIRAT